jgi:hypothetical protein
LSYELSFSQRPKLKKHLQPADYIDLHQGRPLWRQRRREARRRLYIIAHSQGSVTYSTMHRGDSRNGLLMALFCRANRAEQCRLSGADRPTYAQCEFFAF